jgi:hypothetical protein
MLWSSALVGGFARGDLVDQLDDAAPQPGIGNARERSRQRQTLGTCQEIGNVGRRGPSGEAVGAGDAARSSLEQKRNRYLEFSEICWMRLAPTRLVPFSYFWTCWNVSPKASPSLSWLMPSMMRRMRTRLPTYLSTGLGVLIDISDPWDTSGQNLK